VREHSGKKVLDAKYNTKNPNIFSFHDLQPSTFWNGVMWASKAVKFGYKWHVGNGKSIKFWEDIWFWNSALANHFWDLYFVSNQQSKTIFELWDGHEIRGIFRRTFTEDMTIQWQKLLGVARSISISNEEDQLMAIQFFWGLFFELFVCYHQL
jgi:hypothetical protein